MRSPDELSALFRAQGLKVTPQRQRIFRVLYGNETHPTAEAVYAAAQPDMPTMSLKTVYQTLNDLAEMGEIAQLDVGTGANRFDPNVERTHHHLVCNHCGKIRDVQVDVGPLAIPPADRQGFVVDSAEILFRGQCEDCVGLPPHSPNPPKQKEHHG